MTESNVHRPNTERSHVSNGSVVLPLVQSLRSLEAQANRLVDRLVDALGRLHPLLHHPLADHETGQAVGDPSPHLLGLYGAPLHLATLLHAVDSAQVASGELHDVV